jgi:hypothetical protein
MSGQRYPLQGRAARSERLDVAALESKQCDHICSSLLAQLKALGSSQG